MILSQYHIFELDTINIYSVCTISVAHGIDVLCWNCCEGPAASQYINGECRKQLALICLIGDMTWASTLVRTISVAHDIDVLCWNCCEGLAASQYINGEYRKQPLFV